MKNINIILIGMPGCGKTTIGRKLSELIGFQFVDTDKIIETQQQSSIRDIFDNKGERYFRILERDLVNKIEFMNNKVIATGGGMPIFLNNMGHLKKYGITIFLDIPLKYILERTKRNNKRPLLNSHNDNDLERRIKQIYMERINIYNKCDIKICTYENSVYHMCKLILSKIEKYEINSKYKY